ncbi:CLUMA_CG019204, isoform A [Clunio marinus]|uniref:CLUMA_CG019204, isoform A n=1 Tax=Clunio marinus TaxID=568069 RepID=A0A1J1J1V0_9DIPT|nr:CLUMA_CG019204, isoform A [Clunio marinus]
MLLSYEISTSNTKLFLIIHYIFLFSLPFCWEISKDEGIKQGEEKSNYELFKKKSTEMLKGRRKENLQTQFTFKWRCLVGLRDVGGRKCILSCLRRRLFTSLHVSSDLRRNSNHRKSKANEKT